MPVQTRLVLEQETINDLDNLCFDGINEIVCKKLLDKDHSICLLLDRYNMQHFNNITVLRVVGGNNEIGYRNGFKSILYFLKATTSLKQLDLGFREMTNVQIRRTMKGLVHNNTVTTLNLYDSKTKFSKKGCKLISKMMAKTNTLTELRLVRNEINDDGIEIIMNGLLHNKSITTLDLSCNKFGQKGCESISKSLITNTIFLTHLDLGGNRIDDEGMRYIMNGLLCNKSISKLDLPKNRFGLEGCRCIAEMLITNTTLTHLEVGDNNSIDDAGISMIMNGLVNNNSLVLLMLNNIAISKEGCKWISNMLARNSSLKYLCIGGHWDKKICDGGTRRIMNGLVRNKSLISLDLRGNKIGNKGCKYISQMLTKNYTLRALGLFDNRFDDSGIGMIMEGLNNNNKSLTVLDLNDNYLTREGCQHILEMLQSNIYVKYLHFSYGNEWWIGNEDIINKIGFQLSLNYTGFLRKMHNKDNSKISHEDWVDTFLKISNVDTFLEDWYKQIYIDCETNNNNERRTSDNNSDSDSNNNGTGNLSCCYYSGNLSCCYYFLRNLHDKVIIN